MNRIKTVYIADDDEDDRLLLSDAIKSVISEVIIKEVINGIQLIDQIKTDCDAGDIVVLLDMNMPRMNGLEALKIIKSDPALLHIPIIMISTSSNPELISRAYLDGINAYVAKPYIFAEYEELARAINVCFLHNYPAFDQMVTIKDLSINSVLVIDDNQDESKLIKLALKHSVPHVDVIHISDQAASLEFIASHWEHCTSKPQLILLDLYLPDRKGGLYLLEVIKEFLLSKQLLTIPIIVVSQSDDPTDITDCYRLRANAYMTKTSDLTVWFSFFSYLCHFWMDTIVTHSKLTKY